MINPEEFLSLVQARQSDRAYDLSRPVESEKLKRILEAARLAPSACNAQPWHFTVITDPELTARIGRAAAGLGMNKFAKDAPYISSSRKKVPTSPPFSAVR